jgi:hypothetical protein
MADAEQWAWLDVVRTTVAASASLLIARVLRMPEAYWAAIVGPTVIAFVAGMFAIAIISPIGMRGSHWRSSCSSRAPSPRGRSPGTGSLRSRSASP